VHDFCIVIPARYESSRFPGKPLVEIGGIPMIIRTYNQCIKSAEPSKVYIATDDDRIHNLCDHHKINVIMTSANCLTGTDRVAEAAKKIDSSIYINVQGDEPFLDPIDLSYFIDESLKNPEIIHNAFCRISDDSQFKNKNIPKVVFDSNQKLMYMSRAPIPITKTGELIQSNRQVCMYSFPKKKLEQFSSYKAKTPLENIEDIEILRFIETGHEIQMIRVSENSIALDTPEDLKTIQEMLVKGILK
jgi:3-deoxy-manno-octulosonate cytidylyltransferase (CMP-KDO synthetase)